MSDFTWQFPPNTSSDIEGPNDAGITHFMSNRQDSVIREAIQNSLDAQADLSKPVKVKFEITQRTSSDFAAPSLIEALKAAIRPAVLTTRTSHLRFQTNFAICKDMPSYWRKPTRSSVSWSRRISPVCKTSGTPTDRGTPTSNRCFGCFSSLFTLTDKIIDNNIATGRCSNYHIRFSKYDWLVV